MDQVASVAVCDNKGRILLGKRKDSGRYTLPGGHLETGERPIDGAVRELLEESGISAHGMNYLTSKVVIKKDGNPVLVHSYQYAAEPENITSKNDPDMEVARWEWIDVSQGLPKDIKDMLHNREDVTLTALGIQKCESFYIDLHKSKPHMYLRKYKGAHGKWIYIYHEGKNNGRVIPEETYNDIRTAAEHGHAGAKKILETMQEHPQQKIEDLRYLANEHGHEGAKNHLDKLGIPHSPVKLHELIVREPNSFEKELEPLVAASARDAIFRSVSERVFDHLERYPDSPFTKALATKGIKKEDLKKDLDKQKTIKGMIEATHDYTSAIDKAHKDLGEPRNSAAAQAGGYGNYAFSGAISSLKGGDHISEGMADHLKETKGVDVDWAGKDSEHKKHLAGAQERIQERARQAEKERKEKVEAEKRKKAAEERAKQELEGSMAAHVATLVSGGMRPEEQIKLQKFFNKAFKNRPDGQTLRKEDWPYDFSENGITADIDYIDVSDNTVKFTMGTQDANGRDITKKWVRQWTILPNGGLEIYNDYLIVKDSMRGKHKIGELVNKSQIQFLKKYSPNGQIKVTAGLDVGGYNWANQGFSFQDDYELKDNRNRFQRFCRDKGVILSDEDMKAFKQPCHFSSFDTGYTEKKNINGRMEDVHLGKLYLLGNNWHGILKTKDMNDDNPAFKFFMNYSALKRKTWEVLESPYKEKVTRERSNREGQVQTQGSSGSQSGSSGQNQGTVSRIARLPRGYKNWTESQLDNFLTENGTRLTFQQRQNLRAAKRAAKRRAA